MTHPHHNIRGHESGVTLLELILVLAILAITATLALPSVVRTTRSTALESASSLLVTALRSARAAAERSNTERALIIDVPNRRYEFDGAVHRLPAGVSVTANLISGESSGEGRTNIRFYPEGTASGGHIELAMGSRSAAIDVDWMTGATSLTWMRR